MRRRHGYGHYYGCGGGIEGLLILAVLAVMALPFVGGYLIIAGKNEDDKVIGTILLIVGVIIYIAVGLNS